MAFFPSTIEIKMLRALGHTASDDGGLRTIESAVFCIALVAKRFGIDVEPQAMDQISEDHNGGMTAWQMLTTLDYLGLHTRYVKIEHYQLQRVNTPAVVSLDQKTFGVIDRLRGRKALVSSQAGREWVEISRLSEKLSLSAVEITSGPAFKKAFHRGTLGVIDIFGIAKGMRHSAFQVIAISLLMQAVALLSPYYMQLIVDRAVPDQRIGLIAALIVGFGLLAIVNGLAMLLRALALSAAASIQGFELSSSLARHLVRLPIRWYQGRRLGEIVQRFRATIPIQKMLSENAPVVFVDGLLGCITLIVMIAYSKILAGLSLAMFAAYAATRAFFFKRQKHCQAQSLAASAAEYSTLMETVRSMQTIRLLGLETMRHALWQKSQMESYNADIEYHRNENLQEAAHGTLYGLENVIIIGVGAVLVITDRLTIGMLFAFLAYKTQFLTAAASLAEKLGEFRMLRLHLDNMSDIALEREDRSLAANQGHSTHQIDGCVRIVEVGYQFSEDGPFVLRGLNIDIKPGESVAITGPSGSGKSTLARLILGLADPTVGQILIDNLTIDELGYRNYRNQVAGVLQDDVLFATSIAQNISSFEEHVDFARVREVARAAGILDEIEGMRDGFATILGDLGMALSGGQRQRILLARALYRRPRILLLDEGTSHLDEARESMINDMIASMGITRILIAHRKATIESAERVIYLKDGQIEESLP